MAMAVAPVSRLSSAHSIYISHTSMSSSNRYLNLAFSSSSKHASSQASLMTEYSFSSRRVVARSPQAAMATISQNAHRIAYTMATLKVQGKVALIPYLTAGDPDLDTTAEAMQVLDMCGCDIIELGVPYSDPLADGPVIQAAATRSLAQGTTLDKVLDMLKQFSVQVVPNLKAPVVLFTYYNPILKRGPEVFMKAVKAAGASGLVVPDLPLEETDKLREFTFANDLELILLTTPTTPQSRAKVIARASEGFVYLVSLTGVTGARESVHSRVQSLLKDLKQVAEWGADGVIVGSAMVKLLGEAATPKEGLVSLEKFARELKAVLPK
ncbi:hypothetical protein CY35_13G070700 [Sphagnum magellanicum]|nr:hypothetical protein CY35_13G070700 [Sphagnum magellanicum]